MFNHEDEIVVHIKERIENLKRAYDMYVSEESDMMEEWEEGYRAARIDSINSEQDFLVQLLTDFVRV